MGEQDKPNENKKVPALLLYQLEDATEQKTYTEKVETLLEIVARYSSFHEGFSYEEGYSVNRTLQEMFGASNTALIQGQSMEEESEDKEFFMINDKFWTEIFPAIPFASMRLFELEVADCVRNEDLLLQGLETITFSINVVDTRIDQWMIGPLLDPETKEYLGIHVLMLCVPRHKAYAILKSTCDKETYSDLEPLTEQNKQESVWVHFPAGGIRHLRFIVKSKAADTGSN